MVDMFTGLAENLRGIDPSREPGGNQYNDRMADTIVKLNEAVREWEANLAAYVDEAKDAALRISQLKDTTERAALMLHYVEGITWERVCVRLDYTWDGMMAIRKRAVEHVYGLMPHEWRDPIPPAID